MLLMALYDPSGWRKMTSLCGLNSLFCFEKCHSIPHERSLFMFLNVAFCVLVGMFKPFCGVKMSIWCHPSVRIADLQWYWRNNRDILRSALIAQIGYYLGHNNNKLLILWGRHVVSLPYCNRYCCACFSIWLQHHL